MFWSLPANSAEVPTLATTEGFLLVANGSVEAPKAEAAHPTTKAYVTGYNTVAGQTDDSPCIAAGGNICGRMDTVACPSHIPLHTWVLIGGKKYECMDRTAAKHNGRFDISCDKDLKCPYTLTGWREVAVLK